MYYKAPGIKLQLAYWHKGCLGRSITSPYSVHLLIPSFKCKDHVPLINLLHSFNFFLYRNTLPRIFNINSNLLFSASTYDVDNFLSFLFNYSLVQGNKLAIASFQFGTNLCSVSFVSKVLVKSVRRAWVGFSLIVMILNNLRFIRVAANIPSVIKILKDKKTSHE